MTKGSNSRYNSTDVLSRVTHRNQMMKKDEKADHAQIKELKWIQTGTISTIKVDFKEFSMIRCQSSHIDIQRDGRHYWVKCKQTVSRADIGEGCAAANLSLIGEFS